MHKPFLTESQYQAVLHSALTKQGLNGEVIQSLIASRFPMCLSSALAECDARGITLTEADADEFLWALADGRPPKAESGELIEARYCEWRPETVQALLTWASLNDRGLPSRTSHEIAKILNYEPEFN